MGSEWIKHDGGKCPESVSTALSVGLKFRGWTTQESVTNARFYSWSHGGHPGDIVAYRIEIASEPQQEPPPEKMGVLWTSHNGGECPDEVVFAYRNRQCVILLFRDHGRTEILRCFPRCYRWSHSGLPGDIMGYSIETADEPKQEPQPAKPMRPLGPIPDGWRALEPEDMVERFDVIWDAEKRKGAPVSMWGYPFKNDNGTGLVIIRQLPNGYHRGCGSINVGVDR